MFKVMLLKHDLLHSCLLSQEKMPRTQESNIGLIFNDRQAKTVGYHDLPILRLVSLAIAAAGKRLAAVIVCRDMGDAMSAGFRELKEIIFILFC